MTSPDLDLWTRVLEQAGADALAQGEKIVAKGSLNIKNRARELAPKGPHTPHYASSISYDIERGATWVEGEIGPVQGRLQRGLGNLLEYGSSHNAPHPHHEPALDEEEPRFYKAAGDLAEQLLDRHYG